MRAHRFFSSTVTPLAAIVLALAGCKAKPAPPLEKSAAAATRDAGPPKRGKKGGTDVTFAVVSDTHFGYGGMVEQNEKLVAKVNAIGGKAYPAAIGGAVAKPRGLLVTGDLTEWGRVEEWEPFLATYAKCNVPVFEVIGNHDKVHGPWVGDQVAKRHGGHFYAWSWDDVRFVALGEAPDDEGLAFLAKELDGLERDVPLVVYFHLALLGPWSTDNWFADGDYKERLAKLLEGRNVAAIFHGHHHATGHYLWHGIDVFKPGAVKHDAHTFAVVHVTDERFSLGSYDWENDAWASSFEKTLPHR